MNPITELRESYLLSVGEFAKKIGVAPRTVYLWEKGIMPRSKSIRRIAEAFILTQEETVSLYHKCTKNHTNIR